MVSVTINNEEYKLTSEPYHGVVREVRKMQRKMLVDFLNRFKNDLDGNMTIEDALAKVAEKHPGEFIEHSEVEEDFIVVSTISLATNKIWDIKDFDNIPFNEMDDIFQKCKDALGSDVNRFFRGYAMNIAEQMKDIKPKKK